MLETETTTATPALGPTVKVVYGIKKTDSDPAGDHHSETNIGLKQK